MEIEQALYTALTADADLDALIDGRLYPVQAPQSDTLPRILYSQAHRQQFRTLAGERVNLNLYGMDFEVSARTYRQAKAVYLALREALLDLRGPTGGGDVHVQAVIEQTGSDAHSPPIHADEKGIFHAELEVTVGWCQ